MVVLACIGFAIAAAILVAAVPFSRIRSEISGIRLRGMLVVSAKHWFSHSIGGGEQ
jgi:hypothetical protein